jgi:hypothetical protein
MDRDWKSGGWFVIHDVCEREVWKRGYWKGGVFLAAGRRVSEGHDGLIGIASRAFSKQKPQGEGSCIMFG